ncbi:MAG: Holliday junction resolvase RecU [Mycoplasma sp.]|nr:Holliday junction resolvase RecU [Mycoplasma sp.]
MNQKYFYANRGMYLEELINKTIEYYSSNEIAFFEKRFLPIKILNKLDDNFIRGKLLKKSYVDYCGVYKGKYISFEAKQTNNDFFLLSQIKEHQIKHIIKINSFGGISFVIVHFYNSSRTFLISYDVLEKMNFWSQK